MSVEESPSTGDDAILVSDDVLAFWGDRDAWPKDGPSHLFLARAVEQLGRERFGDDWCGLSDPMSVSAYEQRTAVFDELTHALWTGTMTTFVRATKGGPFEPLDTSVWNTEDTRRRFKYCRIDKRFPFKPGDHQKASAFLYVKRTELEEMVKSGPVRETAGDQTDRFPPYLVALMRTAKALGVTSESDPLPSKLIARKFQEVCRQMQISEEHVSGAVMRYAGTFLRPPGAGRTAHKK